MVIVIFLAIFVGVPDFARRAVSRNSTVQQARITAFSYAEQVKGTCIVLLNILAGCAEPVRLAELERVRVASDLENVRRVLFAERDMQIRERQAQSKAEYKAMALAEVFENRESGRRREFLDRLDSMPGFYLETKTDARLLDTVRDCRCGTKEVFTNAVVKIAITSGPFADKVGWVCDDKIRRLWVWP
jgi:hypothetical protein